MEEMYRKFFSENLKRYMAKRNLHQSDVAKALNLPKATISSWCNGGRLPRMNKIDLLTDYFGCTRSDLLDEHHPETDDRQLLIEVARNLPEEQVARALRILEALKED